MKARIDLLSNEEFIEIVNTSNSMTEVCTRIGYSKSGDIFKRIQKRIDELNLSTTHFGTLSKSPIKRSVENIFIENSTADQKTLRRWYFNGNYTPYICSICGQLPEWNDKPLTLILDHINGCNKDDRLENLRWVCPNCNQQLPTTNRRNR